MRNLIQKAVGILFTLGALIALASTARSHAWFVNPAPSADGLEADTNEVSVGLWSYGEVAKGERTEMSLHARAADSASKSSHDPEDVTDDLATLWVAGVIALGGISLSILALGFCLVSALKGTKLERRVSPKGVATLLLLLNIVVVAIFLTHVPWDLKPTASLWTFFAATIVGMIGIDILARAFPRVESEVVVPRAIVAA